MNGALKHWLNHKPYTRALTLDPNNIEALRLSVLHLLAKEGRPSDASRRFSDLAEVLHETEPRNAQTYFETSALFARFSARSPGLLNVCGQLLKKATDIDPTNSEYACEAGYQALLAGKIQQALAGFKNATSLDEANMASLYGSIRCQILLGETEDAAGQFEFLNEIHSEAPTSDLCYLGAMLAIRNGDEDAAGKPESRNLPHRMALIILAVQLDKSLNPQPSALNPQPSSSFAQTSWRTPRP